MSTRALQIECLLDPIIDPDTGAIASGYTVYFYEAGTSTAKNVWTEKEKTNPFTSKTLGTDGTVQLYGDGIYKIVIKDLDGDTVYSWDNIKIEAYNHSIVTKTVNYTANSDDDIILVNTSGGDKTLSLDPVANFTHPITIKNTGSNTVTVDPDGSETIDGSSTVTLSTQNKTLILYPDQDAGEWKKAERDESYLIDDDGDTKIEVERTSDEDKIRGKIAGVDKLLIDGSILQSVNRIQADNSFSDGTYNIDFPTNGMANAIFMTGSTDTIIWGYLNVAPPGWKVYSSVSDVGLAVSGGSGLYNVNGGHIAGESWANLKAHTHSISSHTHPAHGHQWYKVTVNPLPDQSFNSSGTAVDFNPTGAKTGWYPHMVTGSDSRPYQDYYTSHSTTPSGGSGTSGAQSTADVRPTAAVGKLIRLDTA